MVNLNTLEDVKRYLDRLKLKSADDFEVEEYVPLQEFFMKICKYNTEIHFDLRAFTFNEYMDGKITFDKMIEKIKKYDKPC